MPHTNAPITALSMQPALGRRIYVRMEDLQVACTVVDVKQSYGRVRILVKPEAGFGQQWVEMPRCSIRADEPGLTIGEAR